MGEVFLKGGMAAFQVISVALPAGKGLTALGQAGATLLAADVAANATEEELILFGKPCIDPTFRIDDPVAEIRGKTLDEVEQMLRSGELHPDELQIEYFIYDGQKVAINNCGLAALSKAGMKHTNENNTLPACISCREGIEVPYYDHTAVRTEFSGSTKALAGDAV